MLGYKLDDLILYAICPLKLKYKQSTTGKFPQEYSENKVINTALRDTYIHCFQQKGLGKTKTIAQLNAYLSKTVVEYKRKVGEETIFFKDMKHLVAAQDAIVKIYDLLPDTDELIAVKYPLERSIRNITVTDEIDLIIFRHPPKKESYIDIVYFDSDTYNLSQNDFGLKLRANFGYSIVLRDLNPSGLIVKCNIFNILSKKNVEITLKEDQRFNYQRLIVNLTKSIEQNIYYPRPSFGACDSCIFKTKCNWKI